MKNCFPLRLPTIVFVLVILMPSLTMAQVATWTGEGDGVSYSDPGNWNTNSVPINSETNNYNVIVPDGFDINFDVSGAVNGLSFGSGGAVTLSSGVQFSVTGVAAINSDVSAAGANSRFDAVGVGVAVGDNTKFHSANGGQIQFSANSYNRTSNGTINAFHADGAGSVIAGTSLTSIENNGSAGLNAGGTTRFIAENGGLIDFSNVQSLDGGVAGFYSSTLNHFMIRSGGNIDFENLATISQRNRFDIEVDTYEFESLERAGGVQFNLSEGTTLTTQSLTTMEGTASTVVLPESASWYAENLHTLNDTVISGADGSSVFAPSLTTFENSSATFGVENTFDVGALTSVDNSQIKVVGGRSLTVGANALDVNLIGNRTIFHADGEGSQIVASSLESISNNISAGLNAGGSATYIAENGGTLDFSNVRTLDGGGIGVYSSTLNRFIVRDGGAINFNGLEEIQQRNFFDIEVSSFELPSLTEAGGVHFNLGVGTSLNTNSLVSIDGDSSSAILPIFSSWNSPDLETIRNTTLTMSVGSSFNAAKLTTFENSSLTLEPGVAFNSGGLTEINNSQIAVSGGSTIDIDAARYQVSRLRGTTAFRASGPDSKIIANSINAIENNTSVGLNAGGSLTFIAEDGGFLDLSGVESIVGGRTGFYSSSASYFRLSNGGKMQFGDVTASRINRFEVDGANTSLSFDGLGLDSQSSIQATNLSTLEIANGLAHEHTDASKLDFDDGRMMFSGKTTSQMELASENLGTNTDGLGNFGVRELHVGDNLVNTLLTFQDNFDNGNRTTGAETLYVLDQNGLVISSGSGIWLNGHDLFVKSSDNSFTSVRDHFAPDQVSIQWGNGYISLTGERGNLNGGDYQEGDKLGFNFEGPGQAEIVTPLDFLPEDLAMRLTAGSPITMSQQVSTSYEMFLIEFDAWSEGDSGTLSLLLDDQLLQSWNYSELGDGAFERMRFLIDDESFWGLTDVAISLRWDADTGDSVLIDNWTMVAAVPEPGSAVLLIGALLAIASRRRKNCLQDAA